MLILVIHPHSGSPCILLKTLAKLRANIQNMCAELKDIKGVWVWPELNISPPKKFFIIVCVKKFVALFRLCIMRSDFFLITP